ncbi:hypothetical protein PoB_004552000 [Plakobranchus ocellatus]|uniref:Uncharacterized protein n=1 Tax=Plakobranchus ocellatus TaxID=259542 RepID=A0AAV4BEK8_9GAST|nr:hypothetical protein PoB_004552000 [Plakobranchus ocellatus]
MITFQDSIDLQIHQQRRSIFELTGKNCVLISIDNTASLAKKAVTSENLHNVIFENVEGAKGPENPDMPMMVGVTTIKAQALREKVTRPTESNKLLMQWKGGFDLLATPTRYTRTETESKSIHKKLLAIRNCHGPERGNRATG